MTTEVGHDWVLERLSEHVDGTLAPQERAWMEAHLAVCPSCTTVLEELGAVAAMARSLGPLEPPADLWFGVARGLEPRGGAGRSWRAPGIPRLAAAAVVLVAVSASTAWWARGALAGGGEGPGRAEVAAGSAPAGPSAGAEARLVSAGSEGVLPRALEAELGALESVLREGRERLDPATVDVLERNLLVIERALEDSYRALALDPENEFLRGHLQRTYERKLEYLREVSRIVERAG